MEMPEMNFPDARRICLVQLPVPDPNFLLTRANVPLAAACLKGAAAGLGKDILIMPPEIADRSGDAGILSWLLSGGFDAVGFSLYLWNRERSVWLARKLKEEKPGMLCVSGGPEVQAGDPGLSVFDAAIAGEGEEAFFRLLGGVGRYQNPFCPLHAREMPSLERLTLLQPYLSGALEAGPGRPVFLETMRGCPHECAYCHYGRNSGKPRYIPLGAVEAVFEKAAASGAAELYLMDPSLSARANFEDFLESAGRWNRKRMRIHAELPLEDVSAERAALMAEAGIVSVEAGLQSSNPAALKAVGRSWDRKKFESGARFLSDAGIEVQLGLILGLPFDGLKQIEASLRYAAELGLADKAGAFPLAVLPGTELRARSGEFRMKYMEAPPYYLLSNAWLSVQDMRAAARLPGEIWGRDQQEPIKPHFSAAARPIEYLDLRSASGMDALSLPEEHSSSLTLLIGPPELTERNALLAAARRLLKAAPFTQYQLVWTAEKESLPDFADMDIISAAFSLPDSLADRLRFFDDEPETTGARRFFLARDLVQALRWAESGRPGCGAELILDLRDSPELAALAAEYDWETLPFLVIGKNAKTIEALSEAYSGLENLMIEEEQERERPR
jgi:radical SAM superfamily enzyme YgiQ (UPF0313 family)